MPRSAVGNMGHSGNIRIYSPEHKDALQNAKDKCGCNSCKGIRPGLPEVPKVDFTCRCNYCKAMKPAKTLMDWFKEDSQVNGGVEGVPNYGMVILAVLAFLFFLLSLGMW